MGGFAAVIAGFILLLGFVFVQFGGVTEEFKASGTNNKNALAVSRLNRNFIVLRLSVRGLTDGPKIPEADYTVIADNIAALQKSIKDMDGRLISDAGKEKFAQIAQGEEQYLSLVREAVLERKQRDDIIFNQYTVAGQRMLTALADAETKVTKAGRMDIFDRLKTIEGELYAIRFYMTRFIAYEDQTSLRSAREKRPYWESACLNWGCS